MGLTYRQIVDQVQAMIGWTGTDADVQVKADVNVAGCWLWGAHPWPQRKDEAYLTTVAPYSTGTVSVTNGSDAVTGSGTTLTAAMVGRKFALSYGGPWYRILARTSDTAIQLDRAYAEDTASGQAFVVYQDEYDFGSTIEVVEEIGLLRDALRGRMTPLTPKRLASFAFIPGAAGPPRIWAEAKQTTAGRVRVQLYPVPDRTYGLGASVLRSWTALSADGDYHALGANNDFLLIHATALLSQKVSDAKKVTSTTEVEALLTLAFSRSQTQQPLSGMRLPPDAIPGLAGTADIDLATL